MIRSGHTPPSVPTGFFAPTGPGHPSGCPGLRVSCKNMPFGRCVRRRRCLRCPPGRQGVSSLYGRARPPHIGRAGGRAGHLARPSLCRCYMGLFLDNRFTSVCAERIEFRPWGGFPTKLIAPVQTPYGAAAPPAYLSHNTPRYERPLSSGPGLIGAARSGLSRRRELRGHGVLRSSPPEIAT